jgi:hypothetical protein
VSEVWAGGKQKKVSSYITERFLKPFFKQLRRGKAMEDLTWAEE